MNNLIRNKRKLYWAKRDNTVDYEKYLAPIEIYFNYKEISANNVLLTTGASNAGSYLIIKDTVANILPIETGDRIYLNKPTTFDISASNADYTVSSKTTGINFGELILEKMVR